MAFADFYKDCSDGIDIEYDKERREVHIDAWYESNMGIRGTIMRLDEFLKEIGVPPAHIKQLVKDVGKKVG